MAAPSYVIGFLLIVTGLVAYFAQTPGATIMPSGKLAKTLQITLEAEGSQPLTFPYYSLSLHTDKEQADAMSEEIIAYGNRNNNLGWYASVSGEDNPKLRVFNKRGLTISATDWSGITDSSGKQITGTLNFGRSPTAMIPAIFGLLLIGCVVGSQRKGSSPKNLMHAAAGLALLGTVVPAVMAYNSYVSLDEIKTSMAMLASNPNTPPPSPVKFLAQGVTAVLCSFFLVLCVQSFIKERSAPSIPTGKAKRRPESESGSKDSKTKSREERGYYSSPPDESSDKKDKGKKSKSPKREDGKKSQDETRKTSDKSDKIEKAGKSPKEASRPSKIDKKIIGLNTPPSLSRKGSDKPSISKLKASAPSLPKTSSSDKQTADKSKDSDKKDKPKDSDKKINLGPMPPSARKKDLSGQTAPLTKPTGPTPPSDKSEDGKDEKKDSDKKIDSGPMPPPSGSKGTSGQASAPKPTGPMPPPDKSDADKAQKKDSDKKKDSRPMPPPTRAEERAGQTPPLSKPKPSGPMPPSDKSEAGAKTEDKKKDTTDSKPGKFRLTGNKPIRFNRPKDSEDSTE